jgi:hypothetical protein
MVCSAHGIVGICDHALPEPAGHVISSGTMPSDVYNESKQATVLNQEEVAHLYRRRPT